MLIKPESYSMHFSNVNLRAGHIAMESQIIKASYYTRERYD